MGEKRIINQEASDEIYNDDWFLKDSVLHDTKKVQPSVIKEYMNQGMATSQDLADEVTARQNMDSQLASGIGKQMSNLADFYDTTKSYVVGDVVMQQSGDLLRCIAPTSGAFDITKWESVTVDELFDDLNFSAEATSYDNTSSGLEAENVQDAIDEVVVDVDAVETALETKAEQNGVYDDLVAGNLLSDSYTADNAPYLYRQSPSASSVEQNIVGGTIAWNQLVQNGNFADTSKWGTYGISTSASNNELTATVTTAYEASGNNIVYNSHSSTIVGHKYFYSCDLFVPSTNNTLTTVKCGLRGTNLVSSTQRDTWETIRRISTVSSSNNIFVVASGSSTTVGDIFKIRKVNVIDLTQAFGSTIADYVYSLEQAEVGSGIAWLKSYGYLTKDYYAYDSGSLQSVKTSGRKIVGVNQWDEEWRNGYYNNGVFVYAADGICCKNKIPIKPNTTLYYVKNFDINTNFYYTFYDKNGDFLQVSGYDVSGRIAKSSSGAISVPNGAYFMTFNMGSGYGATYNNNISINYPSTDTEYHAYEEHTYPLSLIDLRGIPKLDSNNQLYFDGDVYSADGSVKRKYGIVDLGSLTWTTAGSGRHNATLSNAKIGSNQYVANAVCSKYTVLSANDIPNTDKSFCIGVNDNPTLQINDSTYNGGDATAFKTAMNGVYLVYELATPTSESANAYENPQLVGSTEEFIDTRDVPIPVGGERKYHTDLKAKLEELAKIPDVPSANGTYTIKATRSASGVTYAWISD